MQLKNRSIVDAQFVADAAQAQLDKAVRAAQRTCKHGSIAEAGGSPPTRICLSCGITEDGWGSGYAVLTHDGELTPPGISRDRLYELRVGLMILDSMKGRLHRGEVTVADLVEAEGRQVEPKASPAKGDERPYDLGHGKKGFVAINARPTRRPR